ncbi:MAG: metallophosphoesterase [Verrucomicrobia bacterium]|nr:metallophosphoesterase [Verrucomicrobiota bacterium]
MFAYRRFVLQRKFQVAILMLLTCARLLVADDVSLVRVGDEWKYAKGVAEASNSRALWRQRGFDDSQWLSGPAGIGFGGPGYGTLSAATGLPDVGFNYASVFMRRKFLVTDPAAIKWLVLRMDYEDGFVAYLNGVEIARRNLPGAVGSDVPFDAPVRTNHFAGDAEEIDVSYFAGLLVPGENVLAIQGHNNFNYPFGFVIVPELLANFQRGPFVQNASTNQIQIIWKTPVAADTQVEFGLTPDLRNIVGDTNLVTTHVVTLRNLAPDSLYYYHVRSGDGTNAAVSSVASFRTLKNSGGVRFMMLGDTGSGRIEQLRVARVVADAQPDLVLHAGDIIYPSFTNGVIDTRCLSIYGAHMRSTPYYFALGNHDLYSGVESYLNTFYLPTNNIPASDHFLAGTSPKHYYSFDHGDAHFVVLFVPFQNQYRLTVGDAQYQWLTNDLARTAKPWKIALFHIAMNSSSAHRFDDLDLNGTRDNLDIRDTLLPVFSRYGVQLVLNGHEHLYERFNPTNGVHAITSGGGGAGLYGFTALDAASSMIWFRYECLRVEIEGDTLRAEAIDQFGEVFDTMTIQRAVPPSQIYRASWHTPDINTRPADDFQGNTFYQRFDFAGSPIPTFSGKFSNLGRVFVNNDRTNLYVGFEQTMIYANNNIFLFIESPRLSGVTNLLNVGNGIVDPAGQGADGLDFLANLSFTNFAPAIGCLLGDELADGQFRNFRRSNLAVNIGQGVFKLDAAIPDVPGILLQQHHSSPQITSITGEENANFIELAIPLRELGGARPGDSIKLGAVVGGETFNTNLDQQTRLLDDGFLGNRMIGSGIGPVVLEGVSVQLAADPDADDDGLNVEQELALGTDVNNADTDGDGLPDGWEVAHGLNPLSAAGDDGAGGDPDHDGFSNAMEFLAGTNPRDPASVLRVQLQVLGRGANRITWSAVAGRSYQLEIADYPFTNFVELVSTNFPRRAKGALEFFDDTTFAATNQLRGRWYRVRLVR